MSLKQQTGQSANPATENPRILKLAGGGMFALGLVAFFLAFVQDTPDAKINMVLYAALLLSLGYPMLLHVRSLAKIAELEDRVRRLEERAGS